MCISLYPGKLSAVHVDTMKGNLHCPAKMPKRKRSKNNLLERTMTKRLDPDVKAANKIKFGKIRSERMMGEGNHFFGKHHTEESNESNRKSHEGLPAPRLGVHHTEVSKDKIRISKTGVAVVKREDVIQPPCGKYKIISLTRGHLAFVDASDYERINASLWVSHLDKKYSFYAQRALPKENGVQKSGKMHHAIMGVPPKGLMIDHINGNGLDNRTCNMRFVTNRLNCMNRHQSYTSRYPGVTWNKRAGKWNAQAQVNGKHKHLGTFSNEEDAYAAYLVIVHPIEQSLLSKCLQCPSQEKVSGVELK
jgi:hypothetical protein